MDDSPPYRYYRAGSGPAVFVLHELPGLCMEDIARARCVADAGFTVYVPHFFGKVNENHTYRNLFRLALLPSAFWASIWFPNHTPGVAEWLTQVIREAYQDCGQKGVGLIGMCITGSLPLTMLQLDFVRAAVLCQPTNPEFFQHSVDVSKKDLMAALDHIKRDDLRILFTRFTDDGKCSQTRQTALETLLRGHLTEMIVSSGSQHSLFSSAPHSVLGMDFETKGYTAETHEVFKLAMQYMSFTLKDHPDAPDLPKPPLCTGKLDCREVE